MKRFSDTPLSKLKASSELDATEAICFRTDPEGRISIPNNWIQLFNATEDQIDSYYLQTRHAYARLVARIEAPKFDWIEQDRVAASSDQRLLLRPNSESSIHARVQHCDCCGCPGRIEFRNRFGMEFLQLCAATDLSAHRWGSYIRKLESIDAPHNYPEMPVKNFPELPANATRVPVHPHSLALLLERLDSKNAKIEITLVNRESIHRRTLLLDTIEFNDEYLGVYSSNATFQLGLAAVRSLQLLTRHDGKKILFAAGPDNTQLLAIESASDALSQNAFCEVLQEFSEI